MSSHKHILPSESHSFPSQFLIFICSPLPLLLLFFTPHQRSNLLGSLDLLESLLLHLSLGSCDGSSGVWINEIASCLAVLSDWLKQFPFNGNEVFSYLEGSSLSWADTNIWGVGAASGGAVGVGDAASSDELRTRTETDVLCAGVVGGDGKSCCWDCVLC